MNGSYFGQGGGSTWLGGLECTGTEGNILECLTSEQQRNVWLPLQCSSHASVVCLGKCLYEIREMFLAFPRGICVTQTIVTVGSKRVSNYATTRGRGREGVCICVIHELREG